MKSHKRLSLSARKRLSLSDLIRQSFLTILILLSLSSCQKKEGASAAKQTAPAPSKKLTIGFSIDTLAIERWQRDMDVFINKVKELGADVIVQNAGNSLEEQNRQLMYLMGCADAIVVLPKEASSITESIQKIKAKGIPVISYDRLTLNADIDLYMTIDSKKVGEDMALNMLRHSTGTNWYCILGPQEDYNMTLIYEGIKRVLRDGPVKINHVFHTENWNYDLSYEEMVRILKSDVFPDAIICGNDAVAASVIQAINRYYPDIHIPVCGQDADIVACQYIAQGKQEFTMYKPIIQLAELAAECAVNIAKGLPLPTATIRTSQINNGYGNIETIWLEPVYVDKYNLDKIIIESGFHSAASVYKN